MKLRIGRRVGRHLYEQQGPEPSDTDPPVGMVDTPELAVTIVAAVNALHDREHGGYDPRTEVDAHWEGDRGQLIAAWEHDRERRIKYTEHRVKLARHAEANDWKRRLREELQARDAERQETVNRLNTELAEERSRIRAAILAEIDDMDPDGRMRHLMEDQAREGGDPGHAGNAWWRAYCHVGGLMVALACLEPDSPQEEQ